MESKCSDEIAHRRDKTEPMRFALLRRKLLALSVFSDYVKCTTIYWPITGDDVTSRPVIAFLR